MLSGRAGRCPGQLCQTVPPPFSPLATGQMLIAEPGHFHIAVVFSALLSTLERAELLCCGRAASCAVHSSAPHGLHIPPRAPLGGLTPCPLEMAVSSHRPDAFPAATAERCLTPSLHPCVCRLCSPGLPVSWPVATGSVCSHLPALFCSTILCFLPRFSMLSSLQEFVLCSCPSVPPSPSLCPALVLPGPWHWPLGALPSPWCLPSPVQM